MEEGWRNQSEEHGNEKRIERKEDGPHSVDSSANSLKVRISC
jgi:hypothetical protein